MTQVALLVGPEPTDAPAVREGRWWNRRASTGSRLFTIFLTVAVSGLVVVLGARSTDVREVPISLMGIATPLVTLAAVRWYRPTHAWVWLLVAAAELVWGVALGVDPYSSITPAGAPLTFNEMFSTFGYIAAWSALTALARSADPTRRTLTSIDSAIILVAVFAALWGVNRWAELSGRGHLSLYSSLFFPAFDGLIAMALVRLAARTSVARPAYVLALTGVVLLLVSDVVGIVEPIHGTRRGTLTVQFLSLASLGLAALHPTMASITEAQVGWLGDIGRWRISVIAASLLLPPLVLALVGPHVDLVTAVGLAVACGVSLGLVLLRLTGMVRLVESQSAELGGIARSDPLTTLPNRRTVDAEVERALAEAAAREEPLVVGLLDLDHFKAYNDQKGHGAGDRLLTTVSTTWREHLPPEVFLGRYGGEEFLVVVRGHEIDDVARFVDGLRPSMPAGCTFSAGLACWDGVEDPVVLVSRADRALYAAKDGGRAATWEIAIPGQPPRACSRFAAAAGGAARA